MKRMLIAAAVVSLAGCSAIKVVPGAQSVELSNAKPAGACRYLGEAVGSQGNWFTGDYTSNKSLMEGARNDLRNKAVAMGGNFVWVQNVSNAQAHGALGTSNTTTVGNVYACGVGHAMASDQATTSPTPTTAGRHSITTSEAGAVVAAENAPPVTNVQQILAAQKIAQGQHCEDVQPSGDGLFQAGCGSFDLVIQCDGATCRPIRTVTR